MYEGLVKPLLFRMDAERAHNLAIRACDAAGRSGTLRGAMARRFGVDDPRLRTAVAGIEFANPLGLAAGFDKNGRAVTMLGSMGFGHVELGSVSAYESHGNPRPRLWRLPDDHAVVVYYGVPNDGAEAVAARLARRRPAVPLGINLVKTNDPNRPAVEPDVYDDFARSMRLLAGAADYVTLNLSCPNSADDRDFFDDHDRIGTLLGHLADVTIEVPLVLKLKPTTDRGKLRDIVQIADVFPSVRGFAINLPSGRPKHLKLKSAAAVLDFRPGAIAGEPVESYLNEVLAHLYDAIGPGSRYALIAAGGVASAEAAYRKIRLGASLVQLYTGLIYHGPRLVPEILRGLADRLERDGFDSVEKAVGSGMGRD
ncbi:quinone-dependent dihydroorotate dehydrogenase [Kribbella sp. NPDC050820]|uniref:quinone-dependent dihydroorotate dehydrogenase n=1 Tax=Kribbella sp. NPDC050820 TaxID=3155408 RepID=UPI0033CAB0A9